MTYDEIHASFARLLAGISSRESLRETELAGNATQMWDALCESGFLNALAPEEADGAGIPLQDAGELFMELGRNPTPFPIAQTMVARSLIGNAGSVPPQGPIVLISSTAGHAAAVSYARMASHALVDNGTQIMLVPIAGVTPTGLYRDLAADIEWNAASDHITLPRPTDGLRPTAALLHAAEIAGLCDRILEISIQYAGQRVQFGRPIGTRQAIQQQLAVVAEHTVLARMAAQMGCSGGLPVSAMAGGMAKIVASSVASQVAAIAHAVHGAIGIADESELPMLTRRLHRARWADGSETFWSDVVGKARLEAEVATSLDFARTLEAQPPAERQDIANPSPWSENGARATTLQREPVHGTSGCD